MVLVTPTARTENSQSAEFDKNQFQQAYTEFKRLTEHEWA